MERKFVFPENFGDSIKLGFRQNAKYDVNLDGDSLIFDGTVKLNPEIKAKLEAIKNIRNLSVAGDKLRLNLTDGTFKEVDLKLGLSYKIPAKTKIPISGSGIENDPIKLDFSEDFIIKDNKLSLNENSSIIRGIINRLNELETTWL